MPKSKNQKEKDLAELTEKLKNSKSVVLTEYRGTTVKDMTAVRKALSAEGVTSKVYKISLLVKALEALGIDTSTVDYKVPVILSFSADEETAPARAIKGLSKEIKTLGMLAGLIDGHLIGKSEVVALADLPSKLELRAAVVRTINAPVSSFVNVLAGNVRSILNVLNAIAAKS